MAVFAFGEAGARAQDATWLSNTGFEFNNGANWDTGAVPTGTAFFGTSNTTNLAIRAPTTIGGFTFNEGASDYRIDIQQLPNGTLTFNGAGIVINGSSNVILNNVGFLDFNNSSTAGRALIFSNRDLNFNNSSTAGSATIFINAFGFVGFRDTSTAGDATITNANLMSFRDASKAGSAIITNNSSMGFFNTSTADSATITTNSGAVTHFHDGSSGGNARFITNAGGTFDISGLTAAGTTAGSIEGAGNYVLGSKQLIVGANDLSTTVSGVIADGGFFGGVGGALVKVGAGTLTLSGANSYTGATTVNAGTLAGGAANTFSAMSATTINAGGTLDLGGFAQTINALALAGGTIQNGMLTGAIASTGGTVNGIGGGMTLTTTSGITTVLGANSYTGGTTVNGGTLIVNGSIANSPITVNAGGTLGGNGTVGNTTIAGGTLSPGTSIGTLTVQGNLEMTSAAAYVVEVAGSAADRVNVTGTATLGGEVQVQFGPGGVTQTYTILHADGGLLGGTRFGALTPTGLPANFSGSLSYTSNDVILNLTAQLGAGANLTINQRNVAGAINDFFNTGGGALPPSFGSLFGLTGGNLANTLTLLSGEAATGAQQGAFQLTGQFLGIMLDPFVDGRGGIAGAGGPALGFAPEREALPGDPRSSSGAGVALAYAKVASGGGLGRGKAPPSFEQRWAAWGGAFGGYNRTDGDPAVVGSHDLTARAAGFAAGLDYQVAPGAVIGFALAGGGTNWSLAQGLGGGKSDAFQAGVYAAARSGPAYLAASLAFANHWMSTDRFAALGDHLTADFKAQSIGGRIESGYRFGMPAMGVTPYVALQAQGFRTPAYSETDVSGGGFALAYKSRTATDTRSELGARFDHVAAVDPTTVLTLRGRLAWAHDWVSDPALTAVFQALPGASFVVNGATPAKDSALASAGAEVRLANGVTLSAKFDGELAGNAQTYAGTGALRVNW